MPPIKKRKGEDAAVPVDDVDTKSEPEVNEENEENQEQDEETPSTFKDLGLIEELCTACETLGGLAETGSGKSAAFSLPMLQGLMSKPQPFYGLVLAPTRELAYQLSAAIESLGSTIGVRVVTITGGMDMVPQSIALGKKPHFVVATPGRLLDHLENTRGFSLKQLKVLVMDEADRLLDMDFGPLLTKILNAIPSQRQTLLFSATMSNKVESLQRASLSNPLRVSVASNNRTTPTTLKQSFCLIPAKNKDIYLSYLCTEMTGKSIIIFCRTVHGAQQLSYFLRALGFGAIPIHGQMSQSSRLGALGKFRGGSRSILVATDVAARGLDLPAVDMVINYDLPGDSKTYIHRVGRTARSGRAGLACSLVSQYDVEVWMRIEGSLGKKLPEHDAPKDEVMIFAARVNEAQRQAVMQMKDYDEKKGNKPGKKFGKTFGAKRGREQMDQEEG
ncbi:hypothetical protein N7478_013273 [Penicillium angulare]|uniref:uncharacterized protein n=1 Tax=Penicillium angulare TaxID=116970 RepID=UPI0025412ACE|nr:uncharacterized protein N7478_013273 [Penicillium angulare]KAJ5257169.1 hypothetical protein N7478_013273 [Penicillium angulare]